jgi:adenylate cyclase
MLAVAANYAYNANRTGDMTSDQLFWLAVAVAGVSVALAFIIAALVGRGLLRWLEGHREAMDRIAAGDLKARVGEKRPDEWGKVTEHFNEMAEAVEQAEHMRETFGQMQHPAVRDAIIQRYPGIGGEVSEVTVLFADIRGFTRRSAGKPPEKAFALLNRFLTLAFQSVEEKGGFVDKILGDGVMALFGLPFLPSPDEHADMAVSAAVNMVARLDRLNDELRQYGEEPLKMGIGIHTGPALIGCPGATLHAPQGGIAIRRGFTAIGETVNLSQRMEQLTKTLGGPVLVSEATRRRLRQDFALTALGEQEIPGHGGTLHVFKVEAERMTAAAT